MMREPITIKEILRFLDNRETLALPGFHSNEIIRGAKAIVNAKRGEIAFCTATAKNSIDLLGRTHASALIVDRIIPVDESALKHAGVQVVIFSENARLDFIRVLEHFFVHKKHGGIHSTSVISSSAVIGENVAIGAFCTIGDRVEIGANAVISPGVHVYEEVYIGENAVISSGAVIGKDGWGYERNNLGKLEKFPHIGTVEIGADVEIGSNVVIDRGTLLKTVIGDGCKINNGTHIGHNVEIGDDTIILPLCYLGGSCKVGKRCWLGPGSKVRNLIEIGSDVFVGMGSLVTKNIPNGVTVIGSPAREIEDQKKLLKHWSAIISQANDR